MGEIGRVGRTALFISELRALEAGRARPLFEDAYAPLFSDPEVRSNVESYRTRLPVFFSALRVRSRWFDDTVRREMDKGVRQVVIFGAGFDCRPLRFARPDVTFYEIDEHALLEYKKDRLVTAGHAPNSVFIPANYCAPGLMDALLGQGFRPELPTLVVWEGNTYYLPPGLPERVLGAVSQSMLDVRLVFDFMESPVIEGRSRSPSMREVVKVLRGLGAPWQYGIDDLPGFAAAAGMHVLEVNRFGPLHAEYLPDEHIGDDLHMEYVMAMLATKAALQRF